MFVEPGPDDSRVDSNRLDVVGAETLLEGLREHDLRRLGVAVCTLGTVKLSEMVGEGAIVTVPFQTG